MENGKNRKSTLKAFEKVLHENPHCFFIAKMLIRQTIAEEKQEAIRVKEEAR